MKVPAKDYPIQFLPSVWSPCAKELPALLAERHVPIQKRRNHAALDEAEPPIPEHFDGLVHVGDRPFPIEPLRLQDRPRTEAGRAARHCGADGIRTAKEPESYWLPSPIAAPARLSEPSAAGVPVTG